MVKVASSPARSGGGTVTIIASFRRGGISPLGPKSPIIGGGVERSASVSTIPNHRNPRGEAFSRFLSSIKGSDSPTLNPQPVLTPLNENSIKSFRAAGRAGDAIESAFGPAMAVDQIGQVKPGNKGKDKSNPGVIFLGNIGAKTLDQEAATQPAVLPSVPFAAERGQSQPTKVEIITSGIIPYVSSELVSDSQGQIGDKIEPQEQRKPGAVAQRRLSSVLERVRWLRLLNKANPTIRTEIAQQTKSSLATKTEANPKLIVPSILTTTRMIITSGQDNRNLIDANPKDREVSTRNRQRVPRVAARLVTHEEVNKARAEALIAEKKRQERKGGAPTLESIIWNSGVAYSGEYKGGLAVQLDLEVDGTQGWMYKDAKFNQEAIDERKIREFVAEHTAVVQGEGGRDATKNEIYRVVTPPDEPIASVDAEKLLTPTSVLVRSEEVVTTTQNGVTIEQVVTSNQEVEPEQVNNAIVPSQAIDLFGKNLGLDKAFDLMGLNRLEDDAIAEEIKQRRLILAL